MKFFSIAFGLLMLLCLVDSAKSDTYIEIGKKQPCAYAATGCQDSLGWEGNYVMAGDIMVGSCKISYLIEYYEKLCPTADPFLSTYSCQIVGLYILSKTKCNLTFEEILGIIYLRIWNNIYYTKNPERIVSNVSSAGCVSKVDSMEKCFLTYDKATAMPARASSNSPVLDSIFKDGPVQVYAAIISCETTRECCISHYKVDYDKILKKVVYAEKYGQTFPEDSLACDSAKSELGNCMDGCQFTNLKFNYNMVRGSEMSSSNSEAFVYPNPSDGNIKFYISNAPEGIAEFSLTNALGIVVHKENISVDNIDFVKDMDFSSLTPGVYLYSFKFEEKTYNGTIIINK